MLSDRSQPLGGEGCPAADITKPAQNRNISGSLSGRPLRVRAGSGRTRRERARPADTPLAQRSGPLVHGAVQRADARALAIKTRKDLRRFTKKYPDDRDLKSWINVMRCQIIERVDRPDDELLRGMTQILRIQSSAATPPARSRTRSSRRFSPRSSPRRSSTAFAKRISAAAKSLLLT